MFSIPFFSGFLSSHREVLWAGTTHLEHSVSYGEWVTRPGDSIFCCSSHSFKLWQVTCSHLLCSDIFRWSRKMHFKEDSSEWALRIWQSLCKQQDLGPDPADTQGILQSPEYGQSKRGESIFILVGNTRDMKAIDPFVSISPHFRSPARPNLASVLTFPEGNAVFYLAWNCFPRNSYVSWRRERFLGEWVCELGSVVP